MAGIIAVIKKDVIDITTTFSAGTENMPSRNINVASLVPRPLKVIGIRETIVEMGIRRTK